MILCFYPDIRQFVLQIFQFILISQLLYWAVTSFVKLEQKEADKNGLYRLVRMFSYCTGTDINID